MAGIQTVFSVVNGALYLVHKHISFCLCKEALSSWQIKIAEQALKQHNTWWTFIRCQNPCQECCYCFISIVFSVLMFMGESECLKYNVSIFSYVVNPKQCVFLGCHIISGLQEHLPCGCCITFRFLAISLFHRVCGARATRGVFLGDLPQASRPSCVPH